MKEYGMKDGAYIYVVYPKSEDDVNYEEERREIIKVWDDLSKQDALEIMEKCQEEGASCKGIPHSEDREVLAIVVNVSKTIEASFLRIMPRQREKEA